MRQGEINTLKKSYSRAHCIPLGKLFCGADQEHLSQIKSLPPSFFLCRGNRLSDRQVMTGRGRKKINQRMDAAIAVLGGGFGLGFPDPVIRRTITKLLKVYGGDDGWPFIEEDSYRLVIDTMLADHEEAEDKSESGREAGGQVVENGEPSSVRISEDCNFSSNIPVIADGEPILDLVVGADAPPITDVNWRDISCNDPEPGKPSNASPDYPMEMDDHPRESVVPPRVSPVSVGENVVPPRPRRQPCYGWISETDSEREEEEEDELSSSRKRKTDWDVRPFGLQGF